MSRKEFPAAVRVKRLHFADFKCEGIVMREDGTATRCNAVLVAGRVEFDHDNPDGLTGEPTFENCRALCKLCHAEKTVKDQAAIAKAKRREAADLGATRPKQKIPQGPSSLTTKPKREPKPSLPPRKLFA